MRSRAGKWIVGILLVGGLVFFAFTKPSSPDGRYVSSQYIGAIGDWYYEFSNGKVTWVCHEDKDYTYRHVDAEYTKTRDGWEVRANENHPSQGMKVECFWLGLRLTHADGSREFMRRRFVPGRRPQWMLHRLPWWVQ